MVVDDNEVWNWKRIRGKLLGTPVSYTNSRFVRCYLPFSFREFRGINRKLVVKVEVEDGVVVVRIRTGTSVIKVEVNARNIGRERERERERERAGRDLCTPPWTPTFQTARNRNSGSRPVTVLIARTIDRYRAASRRAATYFLFSSL